MANESVILSSLPTAGPKDQFSRSRQRQFKSCHPEQAELASAQSKDL
jgi:hypothetical protein